MFKIAPVLPLAAIIACTPAAAQSGAEAETFEVLSTYYATDGIPLEPVIEEVASDGTQKYAIKFRSFDREWVTGTLSIPSGATKPPVVILLHGLTQSKEQWWRDDGEYSFPSKHRRTLIENGVAVLAIDARNHGERIEKKDFPNAYAYLKHSYFNAAFKMIAETVIDVRRAIDFLETLPQVDASRVGVAGFSLGAHIGYLASAVDERIDRALLMGMPILKNSEGQPPRFTDQDLYYPGLKRTAIMLLAAREDTFYTIEAMQALFDGIPSPSKELVVLDGPHDMADSTAEYSRTFLAEKL